MQHLRQSELHLGWWGPIKSSVPPLSKQWLAGNDYWNKKHHLSSGILTSEATHSRVDGPTSTNLQAILNEFCRYFFLKRKYLKLDRKSSRNRVGIGWGGLCTRLFTVFWINQKLWNIINFYLHMWYTCIEFYWLTGMIVMTKIFL